MSGIGRRRVWSRVRFGRHLLLAIAVTASIGLLAAGSATQSGPATAPSTLKAFPGAEGFGTDTPGGRGGTVCQVTNLEDSGPGSLRACIDQAGPRTVIFRTTGTIVLESRLEVTAPYLTIAGQTAPGGGITLRTAESYGEQAMLISTHDVVIRYLRFRPGHSDDPTDSRDALTIYEPGAEDVVIDHASLSWGSDEVLNTYDDSNRITVSWSIISEGLDDRDHSKGVLVGGDDAHNVSLHHNLIASHDDRCPQISGVSVADVRNNVIYNCGDGDGEGTTLLSSSKGHAQMNWVGNYYKPGPITPSDRAEFAVYEGDTGQTQQWFGEGNIRWTPQGDAAARVASGYDWGQVSEPFLAPPVTTTDAARAYDVVLADAGASLVRDAIDRRIVANVRGGTGQLIDDDADVGGFPELESGSPRRDSDGDGMPDNFETQHGTDPSRVDANDDVDGDGYTNIEDWFNGLVERRLPPPDVSEEPPDPATAQVIRNVLKPIAYGRCRGFWQL
jgi:pectate lyase